MAEGLLGVLVYHSLPSLRVTLENTCHNINCLCQLKHLHIKGLVLSMSSLTHLRVLLEKRADSLQTLEVEDCRVKDSQLSVLLPALS